MDDEVRLGSRTLQPRRQLLANGRREPIGKRALDILSVLAEARGEIVTKDELLDAVWPGVTVEENALQVHIVALRKALGPEADRLKTIRGVGYQLEVDGEPVRALAETAASVRPAESPADPAPAVVTRPGPAVNPGRPWAKLHSYRRAMALAVLLLVLGGTWAVFGDELGLRSNERIPVVVRMLKAEGTGDRTETALASGITEELIVRLRRVPELRVTTADSDGNVPSDSFGRAYVVDGSIRSSGDQIRVTARLLDAGGEILWSQTFDRRLADMFDVQEHIAAAISNALSVSFDVGVNATEYGGTDEPEAYAAYLQFQRTQLHPDQRVPQSYLERALAVDPTYIKALAGLSVSYALQANSAPTRTQAFALMARMDDSTARAVAANPKLWDGHMARGYYFANRRDFRAADASFRRVADLDTGIDPAPRGSLVAWALNMGRTEQAATLAASMEMIDPVLRADDHAWLTLWQGKYRETIDAHNRREASDPGSRVSFLPFVFWSYVLLGQEDEAIRFAPELGEEFLAIKSDKSLPTKRPAELRRWAADRYGASNYQQLLNAALVASHQGHPKLANDLIRLALEWPVGGYVLTALWHPAMANARKTDEFENLVTDLGLVQVWRETGDWPDACRPVSTREITCT